MFGTLTFKGTQLKNIFVAEDGSEYKLINSWVVPTTKMEKFVLLRKFDDESWYLLRDVILQTY